MALKHRFATQANTAQLPKWQTKGMPVLETDDFSSEKSAIDRLDLDAAANAQFADRADDLDQQALHRFDPAINLDVVDCLDSGDQGLHFAFSMGGCTA
jgi:hypothetical protein